MKKLIYILCLALVSTGVLAHTRLTPETYHFMQAHGSAGYSTLLHDIEGRNPSPGMNANIGFDYRLYHNNFIFSAGVEGMYSLYSSPLDAMDFSLPMVDTEGERFDMHVLIDESNDLSHMVNLNVPILFGGEWKRFYFMIGPKVSLNMYGSASSKAEFTTYGEYERMYDDFYDMPNHFFESGQMMSSGSLPMKWNMNIMAHLEIGGRIGHMFKHKQFRLNPDKVRMYLAAYVDFGLLNLHNSGTGSPVFEYKETEEGLKFYIQPLLLSTMADNAMVRNMSVGIKYTVAFELPNSNKYHVYDYYQSKPFKRGGTQGIKY